MVLLFHTFLPAAVSLLIGFRPIIYKVRDTWIGQLSINWFSCLNPRLKTEKKAKIVVLNYINNNYDMLFFL